MCGIKNIAQFQEINKLTFQFDIKGFFYARALFEKKLFFEKKKNTWGGPDLKFHGPGFDLRAVVWASLHYLLNIYLFITYFNFIIGQTAKIYITKNMKTITHINMWTSTHVYTTYIYIYIYIERDI